VHEIVDRSLAAGEQVEDLAPSRFGDGVERIRCGRRPCHLAGHHISIQEYVKRR
jgi:hypothetical protein